MVAERGRERRARILERSYFIAEAYYYDIYYYSISNTLICTNITFI